MTGHSKSLKDRISNSKPINEGWTNRVYITSDDTVIKVFSTHLFEATFFGLVDALHGKINLPLKEERLQKEIDAKNFLIDHEFNVPDIIETYPNAIEMERIEGKSLAEIMETAENEEVRILGQRTGKLISGLHQEGFSLGDATFSNFYIREDAIYSIDHEYSSKDSDVFDRERDFIHLLSDSLEHESEKYQAFREGFEKSYREFNRYELALAVVFSVFTSILGSQLFNLKKTLSNAAGF